MQVLNNAFHLDLKMRREGESKLTALMTPTLAHRQHNMTTLHLHLEDLENI